MRTSTAAAAATLAAAALTLAMAWPVVMAPTSMMFGSEIDGRHHDPFTVMRQFEQGPPPFPYRQPLVDDVGGALARTIGPVRAFNTIVLVTFPLSVLTAFLLARYLGFSNAAAAVAGFAYAFAPPHLAHAAYHPHTAQTQWIPLYFVALLTALDRPTVRRVAFWGAAAAALALSNWYGAFICAAMTPFVVVARKWGQTPFSKWGLSPFLLAFPAADLARYGAQWFAYGLPPADHPIWGGAVRNFWDARGMSGALVEQQISLSWALAALAGYALWAHRARAVRGLGVLALLAAWLSFAPPAGQHPAWIASTWIHPLLPMFRAYARFAFVTHLMVALLAGAGVALLLNRARPRYRLRVVIAAALLLIAAIEYAPLPARARDVLPTGAHRWIADHGAPGRVLDCTQPSLADTHLAWLMQRDITALPHALPSCDEQQASARAAALGYRYAIVRAGSGTQAAQPGFVLRHKAPDAGVYDIAALPAPVVVASIDGFYPLEHRGPRRWRWMGARGRWVVAVPRATSASLDLELSAYQRPRRISVSLDGRPIAVLEAGASRSWHRIEPGTLAPGAHELSFEALEPPSAAPAGDARLLSVMLHDWRWR